MLWFSDLRGFTRITDAAEPAQIIPLLNDYAEAVVSAIQAEGGDVLKLIGDGVLAMFPAEERGKACAAAIAAATGARERVAALNQRRSAESLPVTEMYLGLHIGEVFFGNVGSPDRLDFTVVGPAVNEASRIAAMCRSVDQPLLLSAAFAAALGNTGPPLASVGRYALRGLAIRRSCSPSIAAASDLLALRRHSHLSLASFPRKREIQGRRPRRLPWIRKEGIADLASFSFRHSGERACEGIGVWVCL